MERHKANNLSHDTNTSIDVNVSPRLAGRIALDLEWLTLLDNGDNLKGGSFNIKLIDQELEYLYRQRYKIE